MVDSIYRSKIRLPGESFLFRGLVILYTVGIAGHLIPATLSLMKSLTPFVLLISGLIVLISLRKEQSTKFWVWCTCIFTGTFLIEVIGVTTGNVFGSYEYKSALGPQLWNVPPIIGWNWLLVILGAVGMSQRIRNAALFALSVGTLVLFLDYILEPAAVKLEYWEWNSPNIPLQNYLGWFVIGAVSAIIYRLLKINIKSKLPQSYFVIQLVFFAVLRLFL
ncbi:carotenoid biosynthesis protein [Chloroflexota bacterium]